MTEMGFSTKAQAALFEIGKADDWGLDASAFELPPADALPKTPDDQAVAEIKLDLAILKYARFARGGRLNPQEISELFDQAPPLRDPKTVLSEIVAETGAGSISSVAPSQARAVRPPAPGAAQGAGYGRGGGAKPAENDKDIRRLIINMERWRWMPEDLGPRLCVEQFAGVHAVRGQGWEADLRR